MRSTLCFGSFFAYLVATITALLSAFYIARLIFLAFFGEDRTTHRAHESPPIMTLPLVVLAIGAIAGGVLGTSIEGGRLSRFLEPVLGAPARGTAGPGEDLLMVISLAVVAVAIGMAWFLYGSGKIDWLALRTRLGGLHRALASAWYVDDAYGAILVPAGKAGSAWLAYVFDLRVLDGLVNGAGTAVGSLAGVGRRVQTGFVRNYALVLMLGAVAVLVYVGMRL